MDKLRILLAEDHLTVREGIKMLINTQNDMEIVGEAENGAVAIKQVQELLPDLVVMDISMPGLNGLKTTQKLKDKYPSVKILTLTRHPDEEYLQQMFRAGAKGYVLKQSAPAELIQAIRTVAAGESYLDKTLTEKDMSDFVNKSDYLHEMKSAELTDRENEVLRLIALGYSNKECAFQLDISPKTVETHKAQAMRKLGLRSRIDIVRYAISEGWLKDN